MRRRNLGNMICKNCNKEIKSGFNLDYTPFNDLNENAIYYQLGLLAYNLCAALKYFALGGEWLKVTVKTLRWRLFNVAAKVIYRSRQYFLKMCGVSNDIFLTLQYAILGV